MYQYKAILKNSKEVIAEGHTLEAVQKDIIRYKRNQSRDSINIPVEIFHVLRDQKTGKSKDKLITIV